MKTDTKVIIAGVLVLGLGAWYVQRQISGAVRGVGQGITDLWGGLGDGLAAAINAPMQAGRELIAGTGFDGYTDTGGTFTPYGAVPASTSGYVPWYLGAGSSPLFGPSGYTGPGLWGSTAVRTAEQADVRRIDNALALAPDTAPMYDAMGNQTGFFH